MYKDTIDPPGSSMGKKKNSDVGFVETDITVFMVHTLHLFASISF